MARRDAALKLGANIIIRVGVLALVVFTWRPWETWSSPLTWIMGALMLFLIVWSLSMLVVDGRALVGLARDRGRERSDGKDAGDDVKAAGSGR